MVQQFPALGSTAHSVKTREGPVLPSQLLYMISFSPRLESVAWSSWQLPEQRVGSLCLQILFLGAQEGRPTAETGRDVSFQSWHGLWTSAVHQALWLGSQAQHLRKPTPALEEARLLGKGLRDLHPSIWDIWSQGVEDFLDGRQIKVYHTGREENENRKILQRRAQSLRWVLNDHLRWQTPSFL